MERLVRIAATLHARGAQGEAGRRLVEVAGFSGERPMDQLARDIRHLTDQGWQIENVGPSGGDSHYVMRPVDNRLRVRLTRPQARALQRAVLLADRDDLVERLGLTDGPAEPAGEGGPTVPTGGVAAQLTSVLGAVRRCSLLRFVYKGTPRVVHPESVRIQNGTWYLRCREENDSRVKAFVVTRMSEVTADSPGTATRVEPVRHPGLHPMSWEVDPPVDVTLRTTEDYRQDVVRWLGDPESVEGEGDDVVMRYRVTNRAALRARLYELGRRVVLVGPDDVRRELLDELREKAGYA
jgi:hypothetical protein